MNTQYPSQVEESPWLASQWQPQADDRQCQCNKESWHRGKHQIDAHMVHTYSQGNDSQIPNATDIT